MSRKRAPRERTTLALVVLSLLAGAIAGSCLSRPARAQQSSTPQWRSFGPFSGFVGSVPRHTAPLGAIVDGDSSRNWLFDPVERKLTRRSGTSTLDSQFVQQGSATWNARARHILQIEPAQLTYPTAATLLSDETDNLGALVLRGTGVNYELGREFPSCWHNTGSTPNVDGQPFIMTPLWTVNGLTRGANANQGAWIAAGSRKFTTSGDWLFLPNQAGTPAMWSQVFRDSSAGICRTTRLRPWGHSVPMFPPDVPTASYPTRSTSPKAWKEGDRFYLSVIFQFEDGSYSPPVIPELTTAGSGTGGATGYVIVNDDADATAEYFDYIPWRNIPIGPHGTKARILCRTPKIAGSSTGAVAANNSPGFRDLRITAILNNNTQAFYDDPNGDDNALVVNDDIVRFDAMWPRRSRYVLSNDARLVICGATLPNPAAFFLAPTGLAATRDLNNTTNGVGFRDIDSLNTSPVPSGVAYGFQIKAISAGFDSLILYQYSSSTGFSQQAFALQGFRTIRDLIASINSTTPASAADEWAAQLVPGADDAARPDSLMLTSGVSFGDSTRFGNTNGIQWVRGPSWPGVVYFSTETNATFTEDHQTIYFTGASPGHAHSAALNFYVGNRRAPPSRAVGKCVGGGPVRDRFVICYENAIYTLRNVRGGGTGEDEDYRLVPLNDSRGCVSWSSITSGDGWVGYMTRDGYVITDSDQEVLISRDVWDRGADAGEWSNEVRRSIIAGAADTDNTFFHAAVLGSQLHIAYRKDSSATICDRRLVYDFSASASASGLAEVLNQGQTYGWSTPLTTSVSAMSEVVLDAGGPYRLGAVESNARGRLDKFDTGTTDNGAGIRAVAFCATDFAESYNLKAAEQILALYRKDSGTGFSATYYRDNLRTDAYTTTLAASSSAIYKRSVIDLALNARAPTEAFELKLVDHDTSTLAQIWTLALKYRVLDTVR